MGEEGSSNLSSWLVNTKKASVKLSVRPVSPLIFPVCLCFCRSRFLRCTLGHRGPSCLCLLHKRERANNRLAQQELIVNSWSWYVTYHKPSPVHTKGLLEAWVVGSMGYMVLKAFMFERLVLSFESGKSFPRKSHFCQDQTGKPTRT